MRKTTLLPLVIILSLLVPFLNIPTTKGNPAIEDFTDVAWVENDPYTRLNIVGTNHIDFLSKRDNDDSYLARDFGVDYFTDFTHSLDVRADGVEGISICITWALADVTKGFRDMAVANDDALGLAFFADGDRIRLIENDGGTFYYSDYSSYLANTWYFFDIIKTGTNLTCNIWQEIGRTTLLATLYLNLHSDWSFRYVYGVCNYGIGTPSSSFNIDVENLDLYIVPPRYVTFHNNSGGILRVDDVTISNGTEISYSNGTVIELVAIVEGNFTYGFNNFTWDDGYNISNPSYLTIPSNYTLWTYFQNITTTPCAEETGAGAGGVPFKPSPLVLIERELGTPFWRLWLLGDVTPNGIIASIILGVLIVLGFRILQSLRKKRKLKITKIKFS